MIATLGNNHLPFAYVSISLFLSTSLNPLSYPPLPSSKTFEQKFEFWTENLPSIFRLGCGV